MVNFTFAPWCNCCDTSAQAGCFDCPPFSFCDNAYLRYHDNHATTRGRTWVDDFSGEMTLYVSNILGWSYLVPDKWVYYSGSSPYNGTGGPAVPYPWTLVPGAGVEITSAYLAHPVNPRVTDGWYRDENLIHGQSTSGYVNPMLEGRSVSISFSVESLPTLDPGDEAFLGIENHYLFYQWHFPLPFYDPPQTYDEERFVGFYLRDDGYWWCHFFGDEHRGPQANDGDTLSLNLLNTGPRYNGDYWDIPNKPIDSREYDATFSVNGFAEWQDSLKSPNPYFFLTNYFDFSIGEVRTYRELGCGCGVIIGTDSGTIGVKSVNYGGYTGEPYTGGSFAENFDDPDDINSRYARWQMTCLQSGRLEYDQVPAGHGYSGSPTPSAFPPYFESTAFATRIALDSENQHVSSTITLDGVLQDLGPHHFEVIDLQLRHPFDYSLLGRANTPRVFIDRTPTKWRFGIERWDFNSFSQHLDRVDLPAVPQTPFTMSITMDRQPDDTYNAVGVLNDGTEHTVSINGIQWDPGESPGNPLWLEPLCIELVYTSHSATGLYATLLEADWN